MLKNRKNFKTESTCSILEHVDNDVKTVVNESLTTAADNSQHAKIAYTVPTKQRAKLGGWEGKITMSADFNEPMEEFKEYMK